MTVYLVGLAFDRQTRNPPCLQYVELPNDKLLINWVGQAGVQPGRASLHLAEFDTPISCGTTSFLCFQLATARIIQVHEGSQFGSTFIAFHCCGWNWIAAWLLPWVYISLISLLNCINWRSSSRVGTPPVKPAVLLPVLRVPEVAPP